MKRPRRKSARPTKAARERQARLDWVVMEKILFRVTHCYRCGAAPGPLHAVVHRLWVEETRALEAWFNLPSTNERTSSWAEAGRYLDIWCSDKMDTMMNRWHPSRSTPQDRERIREMFPDIYSAMFEWDLIALFIELDRLERANPDDRRLRAYHVILSRRLEPAPEDAP